MSGDSGQTIVFLSNRDRPKRQFDIFTLKLDGGEAVKLTGGLGSVTSLSNPQLSPDGRKILFFAAEGMRKRLLALERDSGTISEVIAVNVDGPDAQFSPDGEGVLYVTKVNGKRQIHFVKLSDSRSNNLSGNQYDEFAPRFSPDGRQIAFITDRDGSRSLCIMNADGSGQRLLTDSSGDESQPDFSPDGRDIAFASVRNRNSDIYLCQVSGSKVTEIIASGANESSPHFTPDGSKVFFVSNVRGIRFRDIMMRDLSTDEVRNLTAGLNPVNQHFCFSADGRTMVFESIASDAEIYSMDLATGAFTNLTDNSKWDASPAL